MQRQSLSCRSRATHTQQAFTLSEEINRQLTGRICDLHFAPTEASKKNLLAENISENNILVTGNTVIDALFESIKRVKNLSTENIENIKNPFYQIKK